MKKMNKQKGITLIALVITIIVLLILAGVAISMLSGENGILNRASEAKTETEEAKKEEAGALFSYELVLNNSKYKYQYGYLTGFKIVYGDTVETVKEVEDNLPNGYKITSRYYLDIGKVKSTSIQDSEKESMKIATGMAITKDGEEVARKVVFGDTNFDGEIQGADYSRISNYINNNSNTALSTNCQKMAANVYNDAELNYLDKDMIKEYRSSGTGDATNQNKKIYKNLKRTCKEIEEYISLLNEETGYLFEYDEENNIYKLKGVKANTSADELLDKLPKDNRISIDETNLKMEIKYTDYKGDEDSCNMKFAYIEYEK